MSEDTGAEKSHEPTPKKLSDLRRRGEVVRSADLSTAASYGGLALAGLTLGAGAIVSFASALLVMLDQPELVSALLLGGGASGLRVALAPLVPTLAFFLMPAALVVLTLIAQRALVFAPEKLAPRLSRIDPIATAKQKFGRGGLFEFVKSATKMGLIAGLLGIFLHLRLPDLLPAQSLAPAAGSALLMRLLLDFLLLILAFSLMIGAVDYLWQRAEHLRRHRMSRQELMDEFKESDGDPHMKSQRRRRAEEIATNRMLGDVPKADIVIVNPTHYAVALKWERKSNRAPVCVAKGVDEIAARIREIASASGVPLRADPPTARALHGSVEIGEEIRREHYAAVAAAIRFAETMRKRADRRPFANRGRQ